MLCIRTFYFKKKKKKKKNTIQYVRMLHILTNVITFPMITASRFYLANQLI